MSNEPVWFARCLDQTSVVDFPKAQPKRIGSAVSLFHRVGDFQWIAYHDECFHPRQQVLPEWQCQTVARIFPAPDMCRIKALNQVPRFHAQGIELATRKVLLSLWRQIPSATERA